ncbi:MAG: PrsW family intramembrane metalloprotease [Halodesulfurarchaeum sp.]
MSPERLLHIARWETTRSVGSVDRRTGAAIVAVFLVLGALVPALLVVNPTPGADLYRVGVSDSNPYHDVVATDPQLQAVAPSVGEETDTRADIILSGSEVRVRDTEKSKAAAGVFRDAVADYNTRLMRLESETSAAFPVTVSLRYVEQSALEIDGGDAEQGEDDQSGEDETGAVPTTTDVGEDDGAGEAGTTSTGSGETDEAPDQTSDGQPAGTTVDESTPGDGTAGTETPGATDPDDGILPSSPVDRFFGTDQAGTPASITPPFPLESLLLAFVFLLPYNFVIQAYGSSVIAERINRRGEPMLVSPATRGDIIFGKALPYFLGSVAITAVIALVLGGGVLSVAALAPIAALFIAATFLAGLLSRSYKELTFSTVTISVMLTGYAFLPAVFAEVHPIAAISPLTTVVHELQGTVVTWQSFFFGTFPATLLAIVLFALGTGIYREEDLFTQRPLPQKALDALAAPLHTRARVGLWTALFIPFVLVAELLAVAILYLLPVGISIPILLAVIALIEEFAKSIHVYAGYARGRFADGLPNALTIGAISGVGFFVAEKVLAITQLVGLPNLDIGQAAFAPEVLGLTPAFLLFAPLVLHTTTAALSAAGAERSRRWYGVSLLLAAAIHFGYNYAVVSTLG